MMAEWQLNVRAVQVTPINNGRKFDNLSDLLPGYQYCIQKNEQIKALSSVRCTVVAEESAKTFKSYLVNSHTSKWWLCKKTLFHAVHEYCPANQHLTSSDHHKTGWLQTRQWSLMADLWFMGVFVSFMQVEFLQIQVFKLIFELGKRGNIALWKLRRQSFSTTTI